MKQSTWTVFALLVGVGLGGGCPSCEQDEFHPLEPKVSVNACASEGVRDCHLFLNAPRGGEQVRKVLVTDVGEADLRVASVTLAGGADAAFSIAGAVPEIVATTDVGGKSVSVRFAPTAVAVVKGTLVINTNAVNAPDGTVEVELEGTGREPAAGHFTWTPLACDFGQVGVGTTSSCDLTLGNDGDVEIAVTAADLAAGSDAAFALAGVFVPPVSLPPGGSVPLHVEFTPPEARDYLGTLTLATSDATQPGVDVPLRGQASQGPAVVARILTVNGTPHDGTTPVRPGDDVVVTGEDTTPGTGRTLRGFSWELTSAPEGSTAALSTADRVTTGFSSAINNVAHAGIDVSGTYSLRLTVTDDLGLAGTGVLSFPVLAGHLTVTPESCEFGAVAQHSTADCALTLGNDGGAELSVTAADLTGATDSAFTLEPVSTPLVLAPGATATVTVHFMPTEPRTFQGELALGTSVDSQPQRLVPLHGRAGDGPVAVARLQSVNGMAYLTGQVIRPLDNVVLTGADSAAGAGRTLAAYRWEVVARPAGSMVEHSTPTQVSTPFRFSNSGGYQTGVDLVGTFTSRLTVTDDLGQTGSAEVSFTTIPAEDLHVQLTWDSALADMDLHLVRGSGAPFSMTEDCFYKTCEPALNLLSWGSGGANPRLDVDDTCGYGPENINIDSPLAGSYTVGVDFFGLNTASCNGAYATPAGQLVTSTVRIFIQGALQGEFTRQVSCATSSSYWKVATVNWGPSPTVQEVNSVQAENQSACGGRTN